MHALLEQRTVFPTELGWMGVAMTAEGVCDVVFDRRSEAEVRRLLEARAAHDGGAVDDASACFEFELDLGQLADVEERLRCYAQGQPVPLNDIPLDLGPATAFQQRVLTTCRDIPYGSTRTYAELADMAGHPRAARAVGNVMARNRLPLLIPCHRVIGSHGALGGFSSRRGLTMKRQLLSLEQATVIT